jgi:putative membrane protein
MSRSEAQSAPSATPSATPSASRTRDHLANERTFLAWVRTALGLIGLGFVLARMGLFLRQLAQASGATVAGGVPLGAELLGVGLAFLLLGTVFSAWAGWHYRRTSRAIEVGRFEPASISIVVLTLLVVLGGLLIAALLGAWVLGAQTLPAEMP